MSLVRRLFRYPLAWLTQRETPASDDGIAATPPPQPPDHPRSTPPESDRSRRPARRGLLSLITRGKRLGSGGQARLHAIPEQPDVVFKALSKPIPGVLPDFQRLVEFHDSVKDQLADAYVDLSWPRDAQADDNALSGYVMPRLADGYYFTSNGKRKKIRKSLDWAVADPIKHNLPFSVSDEQRTELAWLVARFLDAMHTVGVVYGDVSWQNFSFQLDPEVRLAVDDFDSARVVGHRPTIRRDGAHAAEWEDPQAAKDEEVSFDTDRYRFAVLAYRLLVSKDIGSSIELTQIPEHVAAFDSRQTKRLAGLWSRADGHRGTRPTLLEWRRAIRD